MIELSEDTEQVPCHPLAVYVTAAIHILGVMYIRKAGRSSSRRISQLPHLRYSAILLNIVGDSCASLETVQLESWD